VLWLLGLVAPAPDAGAATPEQTARATRHEAATAFKLGHYEDAIRLYEQSYKIFPDDRVSYNLGLAYWKLYRARQNRDDLARAHDSFERFLDVVDPADPRYASDAVAIQNLRLAATRYLDEIWTVRQSLAPPTTTAPPAPPSPASPAPPSPASAGPVAAVGGAARPPAPPTVPPLPAPRREPPSSGLGWPVWTLYGAAGALGVTAIVTGSLQRQAQGDNEEALLRQDAAAANDSDSRSRRLVLTTNVLIGTAAAAAIAGVTWQLWGRAARRRQSRAAGTPGPSEGGAPGAPAGSTGLLGIGPTGLVVEGVF
jgi:tetratricopeptide (TPR) repeat protein